MEMVNRQPLPLNRTLWRWLILSSALWSRFICLQMITNAFQGRDASKLPSYQGLLQVPYTILSVSASIFRTEGVTVGGLSLAASYMAQVVEHMLWVLEALNFKPRQRLWSRPPRLPLSHRFSVTSLSMCDSISTLPLGISIVGYTSLRFT